MSRVVPVTLLATLMLVSLWLILFALFFSRIEEQRSQAVLYSKLRQELAEATAPLGGNINFGEPVAVLNAPSGGLHEQVVVEGTTAHQLTRGPGHYAGSPLPGQAGVVVLLGRSVTYGAPFAHITSLRPGDVITAVTGQGTSHYKVEQVRLPGDPLPQALGAGKGRLTLISESASGWRAGWAPRQLVYVDATLTDKAQPAPVASSIGRTTQELPNAADRSALLPAVLWLQAGVLLMVGLAWTGRRLAPPVTVLLGLPLLVLVVWGVTDAVTQLLPNLL